MNNVLAILFILWTSFRPFTFAHGISNTTQECSVRYTGMICLLLERSSVIKMLIQLRTSGVLFNSQIQCHFPVSFSNKIIFFFDMCLSFVLQCTCKIMNHLIIFAKVRFKPVLKSPANLKVSYIKWDIICLSVGKMLDLLFGP